MITKAFSVYDSKAQAFGVPFFMSTVGMAIRTFTDLANDKQTMVSRYPSDFCLFQVGEFDDAVGMLLPFKEHINLGLAASFVTPVPGPMDFIKNGVKSEEVVK